MKRSLTLIIALLTLFSAAGQKRIEVQTTADEVVHLWDNTTAKYSNEMEKDETVKRKFQIYNTSSADLYIYTAPKEKATGYSVVIYPGGGYRYLSFPMTFPEWLRDHGITAVVVKYRLPNYGHADATLEDAIGAIDYLRANAEKYNIDPQKVGVCGNSAGGHLAAWISNIMDDDKKPCFSILIYGAMVRDSGFNSTRANRILRGNNVTAEEGKEMSTPNLVSQTTPPALIFLSDDDLIVNPKASTYYYKALKRYGIPASMHIYPSGGHGWSGRLKWEYRQAWLNAILDWFESLDDMKNRTKN